MKHQYFGDINDYRKYGLLRVLAKADFTISVCWMLTNDDTGSDGNKLAYLKQPQKQRQHDSELFDALAKAVADGRRNVDVVEKEQWIPRARYYTPVTPDNLKARQQWFRSFLDAAKGSSLVFFDPDNGIEVKSKLKGAKGSSKYVYRDELVKTYKRGHSMLIFQHFARSNRDQHVAKLEMKLQAHTGSTMVYSLRTSNVVFFLVARPEHEAAILKAVENMRAHWGIEAHLAHEAVHSIHDKPDPVIERLVKQCEELGASVSTGRRFLEASWSNGRKISIRIDRQPRTK